MCRAIDEMMAEAREEGREAGMRLGEEMGREAGIRLGEKIGRKEGRENLMTNMMRNFSRSGVSFEEVSSFISEEDFSRPLGESMWQTLLNKCSSFVEYLDKILTFSRDNKGKMAKG